MTCRAITNPDRSTGRQCTNRAVGDGLCRVHLKHRREIHGAIARLERQIAEKRAQLAVLEAPAALENPS